MVIDYSDNRPILECFYRKPLGLLDIVDEESNFPNGTGAVGVGVGVWVCANPLSRDHGLMGLHCCPAGTDDSMVEKLDYHLAGHVAYTKVKSGGGFIIAHYAGLVAYDAFGFLEKNRDRLPEGV